MKRWTWWAWLALAATSAVPVVATAQTREGVDVGTPIALDQMPRAARDALVREVGGRTIVDTVQKTVHGRAAYEAYVRQGDDLVGFEVDASGKFLKKETYRPRR